MRRVLAVGAAVACGLALCIAPAGASTRAAGNGEAQKSASKILADAKAATASSKTVRVAGTVVDDGKEISLDLVSAQGSGGGTVTRDGTTINVVIIPPNVYLKADAASWTKLAGSAAADQLLADKWLQIWRRRSVRPVQPSPRAGDDRDPTGKARHVTTSIR